MTVLNESQKDRKEILTNKISSFVNELFETKTNLGLVSNSYLNYISKIEISNSHLNQSISQIDTPDEILKFNNNYNYLDILTLDIAKAAKHMQYGAKQVNIQFFWCSQQDSSILAMGTELPSFNSNKADNYEWTINDQLNNNNSNNWNLYTKNSSNVCSSFEDKISISEEGVIFVKSKGQSQIKSFDNKENTELILLIKGYQVSQRQIAIKLLLTEIKNDPKNLKAQLKVGHLQFENMNQGMAFIYQEKALEVEPGNVDAYLNLGEIEKTLENQDEAIGQYEQALLISPNNLRAIENIKDIQKRIKNSKKEQF